MFVELNESITSATDKVSDYTFSEPTYTNKAFTFYRGERGCRVLNVGK